MYRSATSEAHSGGQIQTQEALSLCSGEESCKPLNLGGGFGSCHKGLEGRRSYRHLAPRRPGGIQACQAPGSAAHCVLHPAPTTPTAPGKRLRASAHPGSLFPRLTSSLWGKAGGRGPFSVPVQRRGRRVRRGPQAQGRRARSGVPGLHDPRVHSQPRRPSPALAASPRALLGTWARVRRPDRRSRSSGRVRRGRGRRQARPRAAAARPDQPTRAHLGPRRRLPAHFRETGGCARLWAWRGGAGAGRRRGLRLAYRVAPPRPRLRGAEATVRRPQRAVGSFIRALRGHSVLTWMCSEPRVWAGHLDQALRGLQRSFS